MRRSPLSLLLAAVAACSSATTSGAPGSTSGAAAPARGATTVMAAEVRTDLTVIASDAFGGRATGTPEAERAAQYIATRLRELGFEPAGDSGTFLQRVPLVERRAAESSVLEVITPTGSRRLTAADEIGPLLSLGPGAPPPRSTADGEIVFASYGLVDPALGRDDLKGLALTGKVVVVVNGAPAGADSARRAALEGSGEIGNRLSRLLPQRPAAVVLLLPPSARDLYDGLKGQLMAQLVVEGAVPDVPEAQRVLPMVLVGMVRDGSPFLPADWRTNDAPRVLTGNRLSARVETASRTVPAHNVVGILRGSDPALRNTYVAFGAHYDHVGRGQPNAKGDSIYNGADDDGSGTVGLLGIARAMAAGARPKRSALFVWHIGEENGLLGSTWYTDHATVPVDSIVAQLNADMIGRNVADSLYIVGPQAAPNGQSRLLGTVVDSVNAALARPFAFNREWDSPTHPERIYFRSDHYNYARKGVPVIFFTSGLHPQYHKPDDEIGLIDFDKLARVSTLMLETGRAVANRPTRPIPPPPAQ